MDVFGADELILIRHAPADHGGRLVGRTDVPALVPDDSALAPLRAALAGRPVLCSPAVRCQQTAQALVPGGEITLEPALWEQDFGAHDGLPFAELPDLGALPLSALAQHRAPGGESFADMAARVLPVVEAAGPGVIVAHAGTVRVGLGWALGEVSRGLAFEVAPLSVTRLRCHEAGVSIIATNRTVW